MLLCLGDSLTYGSAGYSYISFLRSDIEAVNKGVNGDTVYGAHKRLKRCVESPKYREADIYILFIGVNDILKPFLSTLSPIWRLVMRPQVALKKCRTDVRQFSAEYEEMLELLENRGKKAVLVGLPMLQIKGAEAGPYMKYSEAIKALAEKYGLPYIDLFSLQMEAAGPPESLNRHSWGRTGLLRVLDAFLMLLFPASKDWLSKKRGLELTVDGCHFNSLSARLLAEAVNRLV